MIQPEPSIVEGFGLQFVVTFSQISALVADKIDALFHKDWARHIYDLLYLIGKGIAADHNVLTIYGHKASVIELLPDALKHFYPDDLRKMAEHFRPFLFEEKDIDLILHAPKLFHQLLEKHKDLYGT